MSGTLFNLHRLSTDDGPGLRDTFFLKGCKLRCAWCQNPESLSAKPEIWWLDSRCIGARDCITACPRDALALTPEGIHIQRDLCDGCGQCVDACPAKAIERLGKAWTPDGIVNEAWKDRFFFRNSKGGVTFSGGEPTLQAAFVSESFRLLQAKGIHTALDTCGFALGDNLERILEHTDLVLYDLKQIDSARHQSLTGVPNERILATLLDVRDFRNSHGQPVEIWIRTPLVPGLTATAENIAGIGRFLGEHLPDRVARWELCAFNNLCAEKYRRLDRSWTLAEMALLDRELGQRLLSCARQAFPQCQMVKLTGLV